MPGCGLPQLAPPHRPTRQWPGSDAQEARVRARRPDIGYIEDLIKRKNRRVATGLAAGADYDLNIPIQCIEKAHELLN